MVPYKHRPWWKRHLPSLIVVAALLTYFLGTALAVHLAQSIDWLGVIRDIGESWRGE